MKRIRGVERNRIDLSVLILILSVSAVVAYGYFTRIDRPNFEPRLELHNHIIAGTAPSPYRYRILVPFVMEGFFKALSTVLSTKAAFLLSYAIYDLLAVFLLIATLFVWLKTWFSKEQALVGALFVAGTIPITFQDHYFQPWSLLEAGLFSAAFLAIHKRRYWLLAALVAVASLNRETAVFIPLAFFLTIDMKGFLKRRTDTERKPVVLFGGLLLIWAAVYWGLRYCLGGAAHIATLGGILAQNTTEGSVLHALVNGSLFLGGLWAFAVLGLRYAPGFLKRVAWIVPIYLIAVIAWGMWREVRLLMPLYPVLVPLGLSFLFLREQEPMET